MIRHATLSLLAGLALAVALPAHAASIALQPSASTVLAGEAFTLDLLIDATDAPGLHPGGLYGGEVIVRFDPARASFDGLTLATGVTLWLPLASSPAGGGLQALTFGFDGAPETGTVATLAFTAAGGTGSTTVAFDLEDNDDFSGSFASYLPTYQRFDPAFVDAAVAVSPVPLPGAAWLLATACAAAGVVRRRPPPASPAA